MYRLNASFPIRFHWLVGKSKVGVAFHFCLVICDGNKVTIANFCLQVQKLGMDDDASLNSRAYYYATYQQNCSPPAENCSTISLEQKFDALKTLLTIFKVLITTVVIVLAVFGNSLVIIRCVWSLERDFGDQMWCHLDLFVRFYCLACSSTKDCGKC